MKFNRLLEVFLCLTLAGVATYQFNPRPSTAAQKVQAPTPSSAIAAAVTQHFTKGQASTSSPFTVRKVAIAGDYALARWSWGDGGGQAALKRIKGQWTVLSAGGGHINQATLVSLGVPVNYAKALMANNK